MARCCVFSIVGVAICMLTLGSRLAAATESPSPADKNQTAVAPQANSGDRAAEQATLWGEPEVAEIRSELIRERYPNRNVKIERQVIQDAQDNFVNHGKWKMWDPNGNIMAEGQFENGAREGNWVRWYRGGESKLLGTVPYRQFQGPFISQAKFENGKLHGRWTIYDSKQRKISEWSYVDGQRDGKWTWWYPNGRKMREIEYLNGDIDGHYREWKLDATVSIDDTYQEGRKLARKVIHHKGSKSQKKSEGMYLHAKIVPQSSDDWWNGQLAKFVTQGKDEKHGTWTSWYTSGQKQLRGEYDHNVQVGTFTWWHPNGQIAAEGANDAGGQKVGKWTWWHANGQKKVQGEFNNGAPTSHWTWWEEGGKVAQRADFSHSKGQIVETPHSPSKAVPQGSTAKPMPQRRTTSKWRFPANR